MNRTEIVNASAVEHLPEVAVRTANLKAPVQTFESFKLAEKILISKEHIQSLFSAAGDALVSAKEKIAEHKEYLLNGRSRD